MDAGIHGWPMPSRIASTVAARHTAGLLSYVFAGHG